MEYVILFLEGVITFISPCLLPMLPIYISYFAGETGNNSLKKTLKNASGFVLGFTTIFILLGAFAGTVGSFLKQYQTAINIVTGAIIIIFGLNYLGVFQLKIFKGFNGSQLGNKEMGFFSAFVFGVIFSIGWTPCVGTFLGAALLYAMQGTTVKGIIMLFCYSIGLGIPFLLSAVFINRLKNAFNFIKKHYSIINKISGGLLILVGIMIMTGTMGYLLGILSITN